MAIQGKQIDVAGALHAATTEGILASASEIYVDANEDTLDKAVIGDMTLDEAVNIQGGVNKIIQRKKPTIYRLKDGNFIIGTCQFFIGRDNLTVTQVIHTNYDISKSSVTKSSVFRIYKRTGNLILITAGLSIWDDWEILIKDGDINNLHSEIQKVSDNLGSAEYPIFDTSESYLLGDVVRYNDKLYRFTTPHSAGDWSESEVEVWNIVKDWKDNNSRIIDCGTAFSKYGGARTFDCGKAE